MPGYLGTMVLCSLVNGRVSSERNYCTLGENLVVQEKVAWLSDRGVPGVS